MTDLASLLLLLGAAQGIFFGFVLLGLHKGNRRANRWLAVFLLGFSIGMVGTVLYDQKVILQLPHLGLVHTPLASLLGMAVFQYISALSEKNYRFQGWRLMHLLPGLVSAIMLLPFYVLSADEKKSLLESSYTSFPLSWRVGFAFSAITSTVYLLASLAKIIRHERHIRRLYSFTAQKSLLWVRNFIFGGAAIFGVCVSISIFDIAAADTVSNLLFALLIYVMGYRALRQPEIFADISEQAVLETEDPAFVKAVLKYEKSGLTDEKAQALQAKLGDLFSREKIYLDPGLTLQQLSERLGATPHQVSQLLNQFRKQSFFDFVNSHRVEHFKTSVTDPANAHLSILGVAFDSGFNSKAAFNSVFKKMTGMTPSEFRQLAGP